MTTIQIPTAEEVRDRLNGVDRLLTARKWERAAIVYAFTGVGGPRNSKQPPAPKLNIRQFAAQGYAGLTTPKAVNRYRDAWVSAISQGWAVPVEPGQTVEIPDDKPFPAWDGEDGTPRTRQWRPLEQRVFGHVDQASTALRRLSAAVGEGALATEVRTELEERLTRLQQETDEALRALRAEPIPVAESA